MLISYARISTLKQDAGFDAQLRNLAEAKCEKVFKEQVSSVAEREQLAVAVEFCGEGDTLIVTKLDRRSSTWIWHYPAIREWLMRLGSGLGLQADREKQAHRYPGRRAVDAGRPLRL